MATSSSLKFINQDLRQRSFKRRNLQQAVFSGCDLRGCNFQGADLQGATFIACRVGFSPVSLAIATVLIVSFALLMFYAISSMVFGAMGILPGHPAWPYTMVLYAVLAIAATSSGLQTAHRSIARPACFGTGVANGTLIGFFYAGSLTNNNPLIAILGAITLGILGLLIIWQVQNALAYALITILGAISTYGFVWVLWTSASSYLTTGSWGPGFMLAGLSILYLGATLRIVAYACQSVACHANTSFRRSNLANCTFVDTPVEICNVTEAIEQRSFEDLP